MDESWTCPTWDCREDSSWRLFLVIHSSYSDPPFYLRPSRNISSDFPTRTTDAEIPQWANAQMMKRIRLWTRRGDFVQLTLSLHQYPDIQPSCPVHYRDLTALKAIFVEFNPMRFTTCQFIMELGVQSRWVDAPQSTLGKLAANAGSIEYVGGPIFLFGSLIASYIEMQNFTSDSVSLKHLFDVAIFPFDLTCSPGDVAQWTRQLVIESATIGDVLIGKWDVWIDVPFLLRSHADVASTPTAALSGVTFLLLQCRIRLEIQAHRSGNYHYPCAGRSEKLFNSKPSTIARSLLSVTTYAGFLADC